MAVTMHEYCRMSLAVLVLTAAGVMGTANHKRLMNDLFHKRGYNSAVRPVEQESTTTDVSIWLKLHQIRDLYERSQYLESLVWMDVVWRDEFLTWNESDYGGVKDFHVSSTQVWRPDLALYNNVDEERSAVDVFPETNIVVSSDGTISWLMPAMLKSFCKMDVGNYPFDTQRCELRFGSWTNDALHVNTTCYRPYASLDNLADNGEWMVISAPCVASQKKYECCDNAYSDATYTMEIKRRPMFYIYNLLFPSLCLLLMGALVFFLPPESGEKTSMAITVLLAMTVFMLVIMDNVPATSEVVPLLAQFFGATTGLLSLVTIMAVLVVHVHYQSNQGKPPPSWINKYILGYIAKLVHRHRSDSKSNSAESSSHAYGNHVANHSPADRLSRDNSADDKDARQLLNQLPVDDVYVRVANGMKTGSGIEITHLNDSRDRGTIVATILRHIEDMKKEKDEDRRIQYQWSEVAAVMNRLFFISFAIVTIIAIVVIFYKAH